MAENLWVRAGTQKKETIEVSFLLKVAEPGLEPRQTEPESAVLPLHNSAICMHRRTRPYLRWVKECDGTHSEFERRGQRMERKHRTIKKGRAEVQQKLHIRK